jgi:hypothetical protein
MNNCYGQPICAGDRCQCIQGDYAGCGYDVNTWC